MTTWQLVSASYSPIAREPTGRHRTLKRICEVHPSLVTCQPAISVPASHATLHRDARSDRRKHQECFEVKDGVLTDGALVLIERIEVGAAEVFAVRILVCVSAMLRSATEDVDGNIVEAIIIGGASVPTHAPAHHQLRVGYLQRVPVHNIDVGVAAAILTIGPYRSRQHFGCNGATRCPCAVTRLQQALHVVCSRSEKYHLRSIELKQSLPSARK